MEMSWKLFANRLMASSDCNLSGHFPGSLSMPSDVHANIPLEDSDDMDLPDGGVKHQVDKNTQILIVAMVTVEVLQMLMFWRMIGCTGSQLGPRVILGINSQDALVRDPRPAVISERPATILALPYSHTYRQIVIVVV
ncbi:hypothetical protein CBL_10967 [Carabus blaptoides fortunei]